jgi:phosphoglycerol transferase MdoB-like AlkP superfamily enzyme
MTGMQTNALSKTTTSSMRVVNRNLDSLFRAFGADDYHTSYIHCGDDWFYNRENVMRWFGAEETMFIDQMATPEMKGRWVTDDYMAGLIEAEFESAMAEGHQLFNYTTTIQNHMSYTADKYGADYTYPPIDASIPLSDAVTSMLEVYIEGARDADAMLGRLVDYFTGREEPVILVFFGDHLPYLGDNQVGYAELGMAEEDYWNELGSYQTPFVIWANDTAFDMLNWSAAVELPAAISASFLGAAVLELTGHSSDSSWFSFLNDLRREVPVIQKNAAILYNDNIVVHTGVEAGTSTHAEHPLTVQKWRQWSYYKLKYQEFDT